MRKHFKYINKVLSVLLAAAFVFATPVSEKVMAAEENIYEAEDAVIEGTPSSGDTFVESKDSAHGGKSVGFFSNVGNKISWTVEHAGGEVTLNFRIASGAFSMETFGNGPMQTVGAFSITLNGTPLTFDDITLEPNATYDNWTDFYVPATLVAGTNTITLEVIAQEGAFFPASPNIDYLEICEAGKKNAVAGAAGPQVVDGPIYEAEEATIEGTPSQGDSFIEEVASAHGGKSVGFLNSIGNKVIWNVDHAGGDVTLNFRIASAAFSMETFGNGPMQTVGSFKIVVNGVEVKMDDITLEPNESYDNWTDFFVPAKLNAGNNEIILEIVPQEAAFFPSSPNVDYLQICGPGLSNFAGATGGTTIVEKEVIVEKIVKENKYVNVPTPITKTAAQNVKDIALFTCIFGVILAVAYVIVELVRKNTRSEEDNKAVKAIREEKAQMQAEFNEAYDGLKDAEEKELARYAYALKKKAAKEAAYEALESVPYGKAKHTVKALDSVYHKHLPAYVCGIICVSLLLGCIVGINYTGNVVVDSPAAVKATYNTVVTGYDWGPAANKLVVVLPDEVKETQISVDMFDVTVTKQGFMDILGDTVEKREVTDVYLSDENGNKIGGKSKYITIEMVVDPGIDSTSPFHYDFMDTQRNTWATPYKHTVELVAGKSLRIGNTNYKKLDCTKQSKVLTPQLDEFKEFEGVYDGITLKYASYAPEKLEKDNVKNALIIWLHGMGEGGTDTRINTLGNKVTALIEDGVQKCFDGKGAYVLAPQSPTMWMDNGMGGELSTGSTPSIYADALWQLITEYVDANPDIDKNRIIIGGCSNGGYMTMNMLLLHPDYFAAAYPTCEAYEDKYITDAQIESIKNIPIWFTHSKDDTTVDPKAFTIATYNRLMTAGAKNIHFTLWDNVVDTTGLYKNEDGSAYSYMGHYSWIYVLNNECVKDYNGSAVQLNGKDTTIWSWLAAQHK